MPELTVPGGDRGASYIPLRDYLSCIAIDPEPACGASSQWIWRDQSLPRAKRDPRGGRCARETDYPHSLAGIQANRALTVSLTGDCELVDVAVSGKQQGTNSSKGPATQPLQLPVARWPKFLTADGTALGVAFSEDGAYRTVLEDLPAWSKLAPPTPRHRASAMWVTEHASLVLWHRPSPRDNRLRLYVEGTALLDIPQYPTLCGDLLDDGSLELLASPESGPELHRIRWDPELAVSSLRVPLDTPWCVDGKGDEVVVAGLHGDEGAIAFYSDGHWTVLPLERASSSLRVAFDGKRILVGSADSARGPNGMAYLITKQDDGTLSEPLLLPPRFDEPGESLFGRFVALIPGGPALVGWSGSQWIRPEDGTAPGFRAYEGPCAL